MKLTAEGEFFIIVFDCAKLEEVERMRTEKCEMQLLLDLLLHGACPEWDRSVSNVARHSSEDEGEGEQ
jgi:hypothetical protein